MPFTAGQSGNPNGRPTGSMDRRRVYREMMEPSKDQLMQKALAMALEGNEPMLKLLLERLLPPKPRDSAIRIGPLDGTLADQGREIVKAMANGDLTPHEGNAMLTGLMNQAKLVEATDTQDRVDRLEELLKSRNSVSG